MFNRRYVIHSWWIFQCPSFVFGVVIIKIEINEAQEQKDMLSVCLVFSTVFVAKEPTHKINYIILYLSYLSFSGKCTCYKVKMHQSYQNKTA